MKNIIVTIKAVMPTLAKRGIALAMTMVLLNVSFASAEPTTGINGFDALKDEAAVTATVNLTKVEGRTMRVQASAYNPGDVNQNDSDPCIGAANTNLCKPGIKAVASNDFKLYQKLLIDGQEYVVLDRMNGRYKGGYVDIAIYNGSSAEEVATAKAAALKFGRKNLEIVILD
jgi:3D (Asp-Asp-Asp) domain-containing protein